MADGSGRNADRVYQITPQQLVLSTRIRQMDWAGRTEGRRNAGETAGSFLPPSGPSEFDHLIQRKSLILQPKSAHGAGRTPFHPVNPGVKQPWSCTIARAPFVIIIEQTIAQNR